MRDVRIAKKSCYTEGDASYLLAPTINIRSDEVMYVKVPTSCITEDKHFPRHYNKMKIDLDNDYRFVIRSYVDGKYVDERPAGIISGHILAQLYDPRTLRCLLSTSYEDEMQLG